MFTRFPMNSRYHRSELKTYEAADGTTLVYFQRRFVPQPESLTEVQTHSVIQGDRLDNVTAQYLGDPIQFWRIADSNYEMNPDNLTVRIGRRLRITLPEGLTGITRE